jgi:hypothetical protein
MYLKYNLFYKLNKTVNKNYGSSTKYQSGLDNMAV